MQVPGQPRYLTKQGNSIALMVFLIAYALFEVPSNYFLKKLRPSVGTEPVTKTWAQALTLIRNGLLS